MISNQILQNTVEGMKAITRVDLCVMDIDRKILASTCTKTEEAITAERSFAESEEDGISIQGFQFFKIYDECQLEYILVAFGEGEEVTTVGKMVAFRFKAS